MKKEKMFDVNDAQVYLLERGFSRSQGHIRRMIKEETIKVERDRRSVRIPKRELDRYVKECSKRVEKARSNFFNTKEYSK